MYICTCGLLVYEGRFNKNSSVSFDMDIFLITLENLKWEVIIFRYPRRGITSGLLWYFASEHNRISAGRLVDWQVGGKGIDIILKYL